MPNSISDNEISELLLAQRKRVARPNTSHFIDEFELKCTQQKIRVLNLSNKKLESLDIENLCAALRVNTSIIYLNLSDNFISPNDIESILNIFCDNQTLEEIEFSDNQIPIQKRMDINTFLEVNKNKNRRSLLRR